MSDISDQRRYYERMMDEIDAVHRQQVDQLEKQNAQLRELVRHLYTCMERQEPDGSLLCANCPYENESIECDYEQRMEELGVDA